MNKSKFDNKKLTHEKEDREKIEGRLEKLHVDATVSGKENVCLPLSRDEQLIVLELLRKATWYNLIIEGLEEADRWKKNRRDAARISSDKTKGSNSNRKTRALAKVGLSPSKINKSKTDALSGDYEGILHLIEYLKKTNVPRNLIHKFYLAGQPVDLFYRVSNNSNKFLCRFLKEIFKQPLTIKEIKQHTIRFLKEIYGYDTYLACREALVRKHISHLPHDIKTK